MVGSQWYISFGSSNLIVERRDTHIRSSQWSPNPSAMAIHCAKSIKGRPLRKTSLTYIQLYIQNSAIYEFNSMYPKTLHECSTDTAELNWTCPTMNAFRTNFEGHDSQRDFWIFSTLLLNIQNLHCSTNRQRQKPLQTPFFENLNIPSLLFK